jgi:hypothetical protein
MTFSTICSLSILSSAVKCDAVHIVDWEIYICTIFRSNIVVTISFFFSFFSLFCISCRQMSTLKKKKQKKKWLLELIFFFYPRVYAWPSLFFDRKESKTCACGCRLCVDLKCQTNHEYCLSTNITAPWPIRKNNIYWSNGTIIFLYVFNGFFFLHRFSSDSFVVFFLLHDSLLTSSTPHAGVYLYYYLFIGLIYVCCSFSLPKIILIHLLLIIDW